MHYGVNICHCTVCMPGHDCILNLVMHRVAICLESCLGPGQTPALLGEVYEKCVGVVVDVVKPTLVLLKVSAGLTVVSSWRTPNCGAGVKSVT